MKNGPCMSVPGVFSPGEEPMASINSIADLVIDDPEMAEAVTNLVHSLEYSWSQKHEDLAWECFTDRIKYLISRSKQQLLDVIPDTGSGHE